jgi:hypothetical protein
MELSLKGCLRIDMASLGQILSRTFFWSYERGTWQYDVAVILILVFVLLTPRNWFQDKPKAVRRSRRDRSNSFRTRETG